MPSTANLKALGLNYSPNTLTLPEGSLITADDVIIRRDNVIESRRGFLEYTKPINVTTDLIQQLMKYRGRILACQSTIISYDTGLIDKDGKEIFKNFYGSYAQVQAGLRTKYIEANKNLYFTSDDGIKRISARSADDFTTDAGFITSAGAVKALDLDYKILKQQGQVTGFLPNDTAVSYRAVWGYKDLNNNLILGAPSANQQVYNYLSDSINLDINKLANNLDIINQTVGSTSVCMINDGNYASTLYTPASSTALQMQNNILSLCNKLDADLSWGAAYPTAPTTQIPLRLTHLTLSSTGLATVYTQPVYSFVVAGSSANVTMNDVYSNNGQLFTILSSGTYAPGSTLFAAGSGSPAVGGTLNMLYRAGSASSVTINYTGTPAVSSSGDPSKYLSQGDWVYLDGLNIFNYNSASTSNTQFSGAWEITTAPTSTSFTFQFDFGTTTPYAISGPYMVFNSGTTLNSYTFRDISHHLDSSPATVQDGLYYNVISTTTGANHNDYQLMYDTLQRIVYALSLQKSSVIPTLLQTNYISNFVLTQAANTSLTVGIPSEVLTSSNPYFLQIYRSLNFTAQGTQSLGSSTTGIPVVPDDELHLIAEIFPTATDLANKYVIYEDENPEILIQYNTNLYTNPISGEGALQANEQPPLAHDINAFKNYTFYSNVRSKYNIPNFQLLGLSNINSGDSFTITDNSTFGLNTYTFITGVNQISTLIPSTVVSGDSGKWFAINTTNNIQYVFWLNVNNNTLVSSPVSPPSAPYGYTQYFVPIYLLSSFTAGQVAQRVLNTINDLIDDFSVYYVYANSTGTSVPLRIQNAAGGISLSGKVVTITFSSGNPSTYFSVGNSISINGLSDSNLTFLNNGIYTIASVTSTTLTFNVTNTATYTTGAPASGTLLTSLISNTSAITTIAILNETEGKVLSYPAGSVTWTRATTTAGNGEDASTNQVLKSSLLSVGQAIEETAKSIVRIINKNANSPVYAYYISNTDSSPGVMYLQAKTFTKNAFYLLGSNSGVGVSFNPDISPTKSDITSITTGTTSVTITTATNHGLVAGDTIVLNNTNTTPNIDGIYAITYIDPTHFSIPVSTPVTVTGNKGSFATLPNTYVSSNDTYVNRIFYSKVSQPDAVPLLNYIDVGAGNKEIIRIVTLRNSLFIFKEDGLFRLSGDSAPFSVQPFDLSCILVAPDSIATLNNVIYGWTRKGISNITETGTYEISKNIDYVIIKLANSSFPNFPTLTWAVGYESDSSYHVYTNDEATDTVATIGFRYCTTTNTWTNIQRSQNCGVVLDTDDKLYMGAGDVSRIHQERKAFDRTDYADRDFDVQIINNSISDTTISLANVNNINVGDVVLQEQTVTVYNFNRLLKRLDSDPTVNNKDYYSTLVADAGSDLRQKLVLLAAKLDADPGIVFSNFSGIIANINGTILSNTATNPTIITTSGPSYLLEGRVIDITGTSTSIPSLSDPLYDRYEVSNTGSLVGSWGTANTFTIPLNVTYAGGAGLTYSTNNNLEDPRDLMACYNGIVYYLNNDAGTTYSYQSITNTTLIESVVTGKDIAAKHIFIESPLQFVKGALNVYNAIPCSLTYAPSTFNDPLSYKQIYEVTVMFTNKAFTNATLWISSDLKPEFLSIPIFGAGNGIFGNKAFGLGQFGGSSNSVPFRSYIPRQHQRCRFINVKYDHKTAREIWNLYGITLTGNTGISTRAYR